MAMLQAPLGTEENIYSQKSAYEITKWKKKKHTNAFHDSDNHEHTS